MLGGGLLQITSFFGQNSPFDGTNLETNAAVNASCKVDPVPVCSFGVFAGAFMNTGNGASINAIGNAFTNVGDNGVRHSVLSPFVNFALQSSLAYRDLGVNHGIWGIVPQAESPTELS